MLHMLLKTEHPVTVGHGAHRGILQVALYCGEPEEGPLLQYLASARNPLGRPLYDAQYALRLVRQRDCKHASVALFCELSMFEVHIFDTWTGLHLFASTFCA